jgi:ferrous iron transport protein B
MAVVEHVTNISVALAGPPNVGKSTVFNLLTGLSQHVGNWPGKTVERKTGVYRSDHLSLNIVDLPGTYSLSANSAEEQIARDYLITEKPDVVVAVLNAASLERGLYLVAELIDVSQRLIIALNMTDVALRKNLEISNDALEKALQIPVVSMIATKNRGVSELVRVIEQQSHLRGEVRIANFIESDRDVKSAIDTIAVLLKEGDLSPYPVRWAATKLLEGDEQMNVLIRQKLARDKIPELESILRTHEDSAAAIASLRFAWVARVAGSAQKKPMLGQVSFSEKFDRVATHPVWGLVLLATLMGFIFWLIYTIGLPLQNILETGIVDKARQLVYENLSTAPPWLPGLLGDGILGGAGIVLTFIPILVFFFAAWAILEDTGYMARVAFVVDRFMHLIGLHGKSVLPLVLGFGCNVPAIMGTRIIESKRARLLTILLVPLVPCTGRMAVIAIIAGAFFGNQATFVSLAIVLFSLLIMIASGFLLNLLIPGGERSALIMEMPLYHTPNLRFTGLITWQNTLSFLKRAGTVILAASVVIWLLSYFPGGSMENSYLAVAGKWLEPVGKLVGLKWQMIAALLSSFVAKENSIATLGILLPGSQEGIIQAIKSMLSPSSALAFLVIQVLFIPCVATVSMIRHETGSWRWTAFSIGYHLLLSFSIAILVFRAGSLIFG